MEKTFEEAAYVICHNGKDIIHPSKVSKGTSVTTGQPEFEEFSDEVAWKERLVELGYDVTKLEPQTLGSLGSRKLKALRDFPESTKESL